MLLSYLEEHPAVSAFVWACSIVGSIVLKLNFNSHVPPLIMDMCQIVVWTIGALAGLVTIHGWYKRTYKPTKS